jgi:hypothetical protein
MVLICLRTSKFSLESVAFKELCEGGSETMLESNVDSEKLYLRTMTKNLLPTHWIWRMRASTRRFGLREFPFGYTVDIGSMEP